MHFRDNYAFLSNFYLASIKLNLGNGSGDLVFASAEAAFQACKCPERAAEFAAPMKPGDAKRLGQTVQLRPDWDGTKLGWMRFVVYEKFRQNPALQTMLLQTGDIYLQETNDWGDTFWGVDEDGNGENHLGKILMEVRDAIRRKYEPDTVVYFKDNATGAHKAARVLDIDLPQYDQSSLGHSSFKVPPVYHLNVLGRQFRPVEVEETALIGHAPIYKYPVLVELNPEVKASLPHSIANAEKLYAIEPPTENGSVFICMSPNPRGYVCTHVCFNAIKAFLPTVTKD